MLAPERRTRADLYAAVLIAVVVAIAAVVVWAKSDARATHSDPAGHPVPPPAAADHLPTALSELWHAPAGADSRALTSAGLVITGDGGTVTGHDPATGTQLWQYRRDMPLCGVESQFGTVVATYRDRRGCSQTTLLSGDSGARHGARSSYMDQRIALSVDGTYALARGADRLEVWRSDLVRTLEYGYVDAPINVRTQPRMGCTLLSAASGTTRLAVLEHCPGDDADRLTVQNPAPKDNTVPEEYGSHVLTAPGASLPGARVIAVSENRVAVFLPGTATTTPELAIYDASANPVGVQPLSAPITEHTSTTRIGSSYLVFTGDSLIALNATTFDPVWTATGALGSPAMMAGQLLLPVPGGIAALDPATGALLSRISLQRSDYHNEPISLAVTGPILLEQRGGTVYGIGQPR